MSGRDRRSGPDPDDWFVDWDPVEPPSPRAGGRAFRGPAFEYREPDDYRPDEDAAGGLDRFLAGRSRDPRAFVALAVVALLLVVGGLAAGGVFSGGAKHPTTAGTQGPTTSPAASTTTRATATTASTTQIPTTATPPGRALAAPTATLQPGANGAQVKLLQRALAHLGYSTGAIDGDYGLTTTSAVTRFQTASALPADGVLGPVTLRALEQALRRHR